MYQPTTKTSLTFMLDTHPDDLEQPFRVVLTDWFDPKYLQDIHKAFVGELIAKHKAPEALQYDLPKLDQNALIPKWTTTKRDHADWEHSSMNNDDVDLKEINAGWTGRLPVRLERYYKGYTLLNPHRTPYYDWPIPENLAEIIGNVARKIIPKEREVWCRWNYDLNWKAGEYRDGESCFWQSRNPAREVMRDNGVIAMLATKTDRPSSEGIGRVWVYPHASGPIVFNAYGLPLITWANLLAARYDRKHHHIDLNHSNPDPDGGNDLLYVNGGLAFHLLRPEESQPFESHTLKFPYGTYGACSRCHIYFFHDSMTEIHGHEYCAGCMAKMKFRHCVRCDNKLPEHQMLHYLEKEWVCNKCQRFIPLCAICSNQISFAFLKAHPDAVCQRCLDRAQPCAEPGCTGTAYQYTSFIRWSDEQPYAKGQTLMMARRRREEVRIAVCESCRVEHYREVCCRTFYDYFYADRRQPCPGCGKEWNHDG